MIVAELVRLAIDDAQRPDRVSFRRMQRSAGVKANVGFAGDERVVFEAIVALGVRDHQHSVFGNDVRAEGDLTRRFAHFGPEMRLEPLPSFVDQRHHGRRRSARAGREPRECVVQLFFGRIEKLISREGAQPFGFVRRDTGLDRSGHRTGSSPRNARSVRLKASGLSAFATCPAAGTSA